MKAFLLNALVLGQSLFMLAVYTSPFWGGFLFAQWVFS